MSGVNEWEITEQEDGSATIIRRGQWYSDEPDIEDAVGRIRGIDQKSTIQVTEKDGYQGTR